jgi:hypothetical protein
MDLSIQEINKIYFFMHGPMKNIAQVISRLIIC